MSGTDPAALAQATRALFRFSSRNWASNIAVPTAVLVTTRDKKQTNFVPELVAACDHVDAAAA